MIVLPKFKRIQELTDRLNLVTRENLTGIRVVRANVAEDYQENKFDEVNQSVSKTNIFVNRVLNLMMPGMMLIMNGTSLAILWVGAYLIDENPLFLGSVFGFQQITIDDSNGFYAAYYDFYYGSKRVSFCKKNKRGLNC